MSEMVAEFTITLPLKDLTKMTSLSQHLDKTVSEVMELCMIEKCNEYLDNFKNNVPENAE